MRLSKLLEFKTSLFALVFLGLAASAGGQIRPDVTAKLRSADWTDRQLGYQIIAAKKDRSEQENTALVSLLLREESPNHGSPPGQPAGDYGEAFAEYVGHLTDTVRQIADKEPQRSDVWPALLTSSYNTQSAFARWLASHSDKTAPYFLALANALRPGPRSADALVILAQMINYERDPGTDHHLNPAEVQVLDRTIREKLRGPTGSERLSDEEELVRIQAITALGIMGTAADLDLLDGIVATDPYYDAEIGYYPFRVNARYAAKALRARLADQKNAKP